MTGTQTFFRLIRECLHLRGRIVMILISLAGLGATRLYLPWLLKLGMEPLAAGDRETIARLCLQGALTAAVLIASLFVSRYFLNSVNQRMVQRLRDAAQYRVLTMGVGAARRFHSGELMSRVFNDAGVLAGFVRDILKRLIGESIVIVGGLAMMFYMQWRLTLVSCVMLPLVAVLLNQVGRRIRKRGAAAQREIATLSATLNEQLHGLSTIKGFQTEDHEHTRFVQQDAHYRRQVMRSERWSALLVTMVSFVGATVLFGIIWYGSEQVMSGRIMLGELLAFCLYAVQTIEPVRRLSEVQGMLQGALAAAVRVYDVIDYPSVERDGEVALPAPVRGDLRLEDVRFRYRDDTPVLEGLTLNVAARETVALVATSGGGKSTVASLLLRFFDPDDGRIWLDGIELSAVRLADLRRAVCVVEQEPFIFSGPLIDNIRYGSWDAPWRALTDAVALAGLDPLVSALPGGLQAVLYEGGRDLSGGQKQRIALARAIVRDPAVLILDEATSALDSDTEHQIFAQLEDWLRQRTVLVMAHRLATISRFERVVVLQDGRVVGDGSVSDLVHTCPIFSQLFAEQLAPLGRPRPAVMRAV